ncbi:MAG: ribonuclease P protein component [Spirochaetales bacterium]|nr:ribonuclease P protein component [Spirochaetales bacterium]MCF7939870.1 ribonuclease P protein component [Spirochaetales bacterium]
MAERSSPFPTKRSLTKRQRLGKGAEIDRVFRNGKRVSTRGARLIFLRNRLPYNRYAVSPARNYGTAVERNRVRRRIREIIRNQQHRIEPGFDLVFILYPDSYTFQDRHRQVIGLFRRAGIRAAQEENPAAETKQDHPGELNG